MNEKSIKIIFMGTPKFAVSSLNALFKNGYNILAVITAKDKPVGREKKITPPPVKKAAIKYKIPVMQPDKLSSVCSKISFLKPDLIIVCAYGKIVPKSILEIPRYGAINIHPSLLPKYRGPSPIQSAILNGEKETGITIIKMNEKMDAGPILYQSRTKIKENDNYKTIYQRLSYRSAKVLIKILPKIVNGSIQPIEQNEKEATYTKLISKEDGKIYWHKPAKEIERQIKAFYPWPGTYTFLKIKNQLKRLKILDAYTVIPSPDLVEKRKYGQVFTDDKKQMLVQTGKNCLLLEKVQLEGRKAISGKDFLKGYPQIIGSILQ